MKPHNFGLIGRRSFLKRLGFTVSGIAALAAWEKLQSAAPTTTPRKVIIIGGGLAGLCSAYELEQRGHSVVILEARTNRVGGRVWTHQFGEGLYGDMGAMRIPKGHHLTRHYASQFGLTLRPFVQSNPEAYYYVRGNRLRIRDEGNASQYYGLAESEQSKTLGDFWGEAIYTILDAMSDDEKADLRRATFQTAKARELDNLSLEAAFKAAGMSPEAVELISVLWAQETSLTTALTVVLREEIEAVWAESFDEVVGGSQELPKAFDQAITTEPKLGAEVFRVEQTDSGVKVFYKQNGETFTETGDYAICTVPLGVMGRIDFAPLLSGPKYRAMRQVTYDSSTKVLAVAKRRFWEADDGIYGGGTYTDLPIGITYYPSDNATDKSPAVSNNPGVMLASYTWGQPARRLGVLPHAERSQFTLDTLAKVHPQLNESDMIQKTASWAWDFDPHSAGAFCWFTPGQHETLYEHLIAPENRLFFAGEHASLTPTWQQGALESAVRAVDQLLQAANGEAFVSLQVERATSEEIKVSWPKETPVQSIESSTEASGGTWNAVTHTPVIEGSKASVTVPTEGAKKFIRVKATR